MNYSKQREIILDALMRNPVHPTVEELFNILKKENPDNGIGIATVYRNLRKMAELGVIRRIEGIEKTEHFDYKVHRHYHFMCTKCKRIFDINPERTIEFVKEIEDRTGFQINEFDLNFRGFCKDCQSE